ncbi:MAG: septal ring lytic transglycosylase RlpA family protein [Spirochaetaceae bacterium]|jgi:rare lipoprotein A|nr:septal ring lytic transglycosylase RlpA family protein [Spirochaetaceae bacterium]
MKRYLLIILVLIATFKISAYEQIGLASWYGGKFHGRQTANGEVFNTNDLTAAHKELPFNTIVTVTNMANGKSVNVRINDRGPYIGERVIDLSYAAAKTLDMVRDGTANVRIETKDFDELSITFNIQIGAYKTIEYAREMKLKLEAAGFSPVAELTNIGITRILLKNIPEENTYPIVNQLAQIGIRNPLVKQN